MTLWISDDGHMDSQAVCDRAFGNGLWRVVRPFRVHIGLQILKQRLDAPLREYDDIIHVLDRGDELGAGLFVQDWLPGSFQAADTGVGIYTYDQKISFTLGTSEVSDMTDMQSIKATVRENHTNSLLPSPQEQRLQFGTLHDFGVCRPHN